MKIKHDYSALEALKLIATATASEHQAEYMRGLARTALRQIESSAPSAAEPVAQWQKRVTAILDTLIQRIHMSYPVRQSLAHQLRNLLATPPAPAPCAEPECSCPSGDGSLRWPCMAHPPAPSAAEPAFWGCFVGDELVMISNEKGIVDSRAAHMRSSFTSGDPECTVKPLYLSAPPAPAPSAASEREALTDERIDKIALEWGDDAKDEAEDSVYWEFSAVRLRHFARAVIRAALHSTGKPDGEMRKPCKECDACIVLSVEPEYLVVNGSNASIDELSRRLAAPADAPVAEPVFYVHPDDVKSESEFMSELGSIPLSTKPTSYFSHPLYARPPAPEDAKDAALPDGVVISAYQLDDNITIQRVRQLSGPDVWAVRNRTGDALNTSGEWEWEPMPSSRDDAFLARCRYPTHTGAIAAALSQGGGA